MPDRKLDLGRKTHHVGVHVVPEERVKAEAEFRQLFAARAEVGGCLYQRCKWGANTFRMERRASRVSRTVSTDIDFSFSTWPGQIKNRNL